MSDILRDILELGLTVVFCGTAVGPKSAAKGAYYAGPGNKFWPVLFKIGLSPRRLKPSEFRCVVRFGIGLTDLAKSESGADRALSRRADEVPALLAKIERFAPAVLAFNGRRPARAFIETVFAKSDPLASGLQGETLGRTAIFVLPSTSGAASRYWDEAPWHALAAFVNPPKRRRG